MLRLWRKTARKKGKGGISFPFSSSPFSLLEFTALPSPPFSRTWEYDVQVCTLQYPVNHRPQKSAVPTYAIARYTSAKSRSHFFFFLLRCAPRRAAAFRGESWVLGRAVFGSPREGRGGGGDTTATRGHFPRSIPPPSLFPSTASRFWRMKREGEEGCGIRRRTRFTHFWACLHVRFGAKKKGVQ